MLINTKPFQNAIQGAVLRNQIAGAKSDGHVTTGEANALIARARAGGVQPSELQALRQLALESRNNNHFDAGAKAALNNFLGTSADRSFASGRLPPEANLPQNLNIFGSAVGQHLDQRRLNSLDQHFKKDDGRIGAGEMRSIMRNIFKDGNISPTERKYLQGKLSDPAVSAEAKKEIRNLLSLLPGGRITGDGIHLPGIKFPRPLPGLPAPTTGPTTGSSGSTGSASPPGNTGLPTFPLPPRDPNDLAQRDRYNQMLIQYQNARQPIQAGIDAALQGPAGRASDGPRPPNDPNDLAALAKYKGELEAYNASHSGGGTSPVPGGGGTSPTQGTGGSNTTPGASNGKFPAFPEAPKDPKDLNAQNEYQKQMFEYQQAQQQMMQFWQMMTTTLKASGDSIKGMIQNLR